MIFVKSNIPQALLSLDSVNNIYGQTLNPWNKTKTCGGSSGGEGGLIAAKCVPCGFGSDIFGSIRFPCSYCGVYGLKPTSDRISGIGKTSYSSAGSSGQIK